MSNFFIRSATPDDVPSILQLIIDLAIYEKEPDAVKATPELLRANIFENKYANCLLAFSGSPDAPGEAVAMALYFFNYSPGLEDQVYTYDTNLSDFLEDLYVKPEHRANGVGKALFGNLGKIAQEKNCARLDWQVLKWNQPSIDFYEKRLGAKSMSEWMGMRLEEDGIERLKEFLVESEH